MRGNRLVFQDWIVEIGRDPDSTTPHVSPKPDPLPPGSSQADEHRSERTGLVREKVRAAIERLDEDEREFIIRFYFMGESYRTMSERSGRAIYKLEALHGRCIRRLRRELAGFVDEVFGVGTVPEPGCPVCSSPHRSEIDALIAGRDRTRTWRPVLKSIRERYGVRVDCPQTLIGHEKYHQQTTKQ